MLGCAMRTATRSLDARSGAARTLSISAGSRMRILDQALICFCTCSNISAGLGSGLTTRFVRSHGWLCARGNVAIYWLI